MFAERLEESECVVEMQPVARMQRSVTMAAIRDGVASVRRWRVGVSIDEVLSLGDPRWGRCRDAIWDSGVTAVGNGSGTAWRGPTRTAVCAGADHRTAAATDRH